MITLPFTVMEGIEAAAISFILSGMWWTGLDRIVGLSTLSLVSSTLATTLLLGTILLYVDLRTETWVRRHS